MSVCLSKMNTVAHAQLAYPNKYILHDTITDNPMVMQNYYSLSTRRFEWKSIFYHE